MAPLTSSSGCAKVCTGMPSLDNWSTGTKDVVQAEQRHRGLLVGSERLGQDYRPRVRRLGEHVGWVRSRAARGAGQERRRCADAERLEGLRPC